MTRKQITLFLTSCQKINSSPTPHHNTYVMHLTSPCCVGVLSSHIVRRLSTVQEDILKERPHLHKLLLQYIAIIVAFYD